MKHGPLWWKWLACRKLLARLFSRRYHVNHQRIILDLTYACNLGCYNCNRSCTQAPSDEAMSVDQVRKFVQESMAAQRRWSYIQLEGGEPTLHPDLCDIISELIRYKRKHSPETQLILCTNGSGRSAAICGDLPEEIEIWNSRKMGRFHKGFVAFNCAPMDDPRFRKADYTRACHVPTFWGLGLNRYGYYQCSVSGSIDRVFGFDFGRKTLPSPDDRMLKECEAFCRWCGHFTRFNRVKQQEDMSKSWHKAYVRYAASRPVLTLY